MNRCTRCSGELPSFAVFCPHCAQAHEPDFDRLINQTIDGRYRIYRRMGQGGLSTVFAATDLATDRVVAVKVSDPAQLVRRELSYAVDAGAARGYWAEMLERMRREAETLAAIDHPNIVRFHGTGLINDDLRYVAMEFLRGRTLRDEIDRSGRLGVSEAVRVALEIASALSEVHARGIVHRDINPRNIMIADCGWRMADFRTGFSVNDDSRDSQSGNSDSDGTQSAIRNPQSAIKLIDFGIAKFPQPPGAPPFTQHSSLSGTVAYASPEQCRSQPVDHRTDIYSLGIALYETLTGRRPFNGRTPTEIALKQIQSPPPPPRAINPAITPRLERTILRALAKNPDERQQTIGELTDELRAASNQIVIPLPSNAVDEETDTLSVVREEMADEAGDQLAPEFMNELKLVRRRRRRFAVTAVAALLLASFTAALLLGRHLISSRGETAAMTENAVATSPSPTATFGSDADALEMAARMSSPNNSGGSISPPSPSAALPPTDAANSTGSSPSANARSEPRATAHSPTPAPAPTPVAPKAQPQMPPAPAPNVDIARAPQPESEPDASQAPRREGDRGVERRENDHSSNGPNQRADRDDDYGSNRNRDADAGSYRRSPGQSDRDDEAEDGDQPRIGPKLIQWSGYVNREREISIEMPGVPGNVEIPRVYRDRVGVVEPPSSNNRWRCAVLRVFGRGNVSIVIRWWPSANRLGRFTARR